MCVFLCATPWDDKYLKIQGYIIVWLPWGVIFLFTVHGWYVHRFLVCYLFQIEWIPHNIDVYVVECFHVSCGFYVPSCVLLWHVMRDFFFLLRSLSQFELFKFYLSKTLRGFLGKLFSKCMLPTLHNEHCRSATILFYTFHSKSDTFL